MEEVFVGFRIWQIPKTNLIKQKIFNRSLSEIFDLNISWWQFDINYCVNHISPSESQNKLSVFHQTMNTYPLFVQVRNSIGKITNHSLFNAILIHCQTIKTTSKADYQPN